MLRALPVLRPVRGLQVSEPVALRSVSPQAHQTRPPPRYTEASLVKGLEELGIGRPSTYAAILAVLRVRTCAVHVLCVRPTSCWVPTYLPACLRARVWEALGGQATGTARGAYIPTHTGVRLGLQCMCKGLPPAACIYP